MKRNRPRTAIKKEEAIQLGLPLKYRDVRDKDGFIFMRYFRDHNSGKIYEQWHSPEHMKKQKQMRLKNLHSAKNKARRFVNKVKMIYGCAECGYKKHPAALHFNHVEIHNKSANVSTLVGTGRPLDEVKKEMRKCNILCANCHAIHTSHQHKTGVFLYERG